MSNIKVRQLTGVVISHKMDKTAVVLVEGVKTHPKYRKQFKVSNKFKAHDAKNEWQVGDKVIIQACRPLSREKKWRILGKQKIQTQ